METVIFSDSPTCETSRKYTPPPPLPPSKINQNHTFLRKVGVIGTIKWASRVSWKNHTCTNLKFTNKRNRNSQIKSTMEQYLDYELSRIKIDWRRKKGENRWVYQKGEETTQICESNYYFLKTKSWFIDGQFIVHWERKVVGVKIRRPKKYVSWRDDVLSIILRLSAKISTLFSSSFTYPRI